MYTLYISSSAYMHDDVSQFTSIEEATIHFEYVEDDIVHHGQLMIKESVWVRKLKTDL